MEEETKKPSRILLVSYPKIVFLYPTFLISLVAAIYLSVARPSLEPGSTDTILISVVFLGVWVTNLAVLAFDFPRASSLSLLFLVITVVMGCVLLSVLKPDVLPFVTATLSKFHPLANASFYWFLSLSLGLAMLGAIIVARFDCWEARPNELLHRQGLWGDLDRYPAPGVRFDKEISDVFEYLLLRSGRLTLHTSGERRTLSWKTSPLLRARKRP